MNNQISQPGAGSCTGLALSSLAKKATAAALVLLTAFSSCKKGEHGNLGPDNDINGKQAAVQFDVNPNPSLTKPITLGYYPSWTEGWLNANGRSPFTLLPSPVTHVFFAFGKPNLTYVKGSYNISTANTGLECYSAPEGGLMLKRAVGILKSRGISVILSLGGETYWRSAENFNNINYQQIKDLVDDIGFAGIDWDFEPDGSFSESGSPLNVSRLITYITESRKVMPKSAGYIIATAPVGSGAMGGLNNDDPQSPYAYSKRNTVTGEPDTYLYAATDPTKSISLFGFGATGAMIPVIKAVGDKIDIIAFQGYNIGAAPNRKLMYDAYAYYANIYGFKLAHGTHVPNEPWGPHFEYTPQVVADLAKYIHDGGAHNRAGKNDGIMIWNLALTSAKGTNYTGVTYLNVAKKVLAGQSTASALASAFDYQNENPTIPTDPGGPTNPGGGCGFPAYNAASPYPTPGTKVLFGNKIYKNKWYVNPGEQPGASQWGPWEFVQDCP